MRDTVNEDDEAKPLEVVFVSSDTSKEEQLQYMEEMHGEWLRVAYASDVRAALKRKYGCFAGKEAEEMPGVTRRAGIPSLVIIGGVMAAIADAMARRPIRVRVHLEMEAEATESGGGSAASMEAGRLRPPREEGLCTSRHPLSCP